MRQEAEFFGERELDLIYIAKRLSEAKAVETLLSGAGLDYAVEADHYFGGFIFQKVRVGAFFYVPPESASPARGVLETNGYKSHRLEG